MRDTFVVQILDSQNATWQGTVTWTEGKQSRPFRSALELLKLIDSSLEERVRTGKKTGAPDLAED